MNKKLKWVIYIIILLLLILFIIRLISPKEMDDLHPNIECPEIDKYNANIIWVIPLYQGEPISNNSKWCESISLLNKSIGMHGVYHSYKEFGETKNSEYLEKGINEFEMCFNSYPEMFKPPQLEVNFENKELLKKNNLRLKNKFNQVIHKVYHCNDSGKIPNKIIKIF